MQEPWEKYAAGKTPVASSGNEPWDKYAPDFSASGSNTEGTYEMKGKNGTVQKVPYGKVEDAFKTGLRFSSPEIFRTYTADKDAEGPGALSRFFSSAGTVLGDAGKGLFDAVVQGPQSPEEAAITNNGMTGGRAGLIANRLFVAPAIEQGKEAISEAKDANAIAPWYKSGGDIPEEAREHRMKAVGHGLAAAVPGVGPWAAQVGEKVGQQVGSRDYAGAAGTVTGNAALYAAPHVVKGAVSLAPKALRGTAEALTRTSPHELRKIAEQTRKTNEDAAAKAAAENTANDKEHLEKTQAALHATEGTELEAARKNKATKVEHLKLQKDAHDEYHASVEEVRKHNEEVLTNRKKRAETEDKLEKASKEQDQNYADAEKKANADNDAAWDTVRKKTNGAETEVGPIKAVVKAAMAMADPTSSPIFRSILSEEKSVDAGAITHDEQGRPIINGEARRVGSDSYEFPVTHPDYAKVYEAQYGEPPPPLPETTSTSRPVIVDGKEISPTDPKYPDLYEAQYGEPAPLNDGAVDTTTMARLQRWYTYLGDKLYSGGRLEAGTYNALKMTQKAVDSAMNKIAEKTGATGDLEKARTLHTEKMEAFHDSPNEPATVASKSFQEQTPEFVKEQQKTERLAKVAKYNKAITSTAEHIKNLREGLDALPKDAPLRDQVQQIPPQPAPIPPPKVTLPARATVPDAPEPVVPEKKEITPENYQAHKVENIEAGAERVRELGVRRMLNNLYYTVPSVATGALFAAFTGHPGWGIAEVATVPVILIGSKALAAVLENPTVVEALSRITPKELETINNLSPQDKAVVSENLRNLATAAKAKGLAISPAMTAFLAGTAADQQHAHMTPEELKKEAERVRAEQEEQEETPPPPSPPAPAPQVLNNPLYPSVQHVMSAIDAFRNGPTYAQTATGPNGHRIGSNDGHAWLDIQTGNPV